MKTLFLRIFFAFWAAMLVVLGTTAGVAYYRFHEVKRVNVDIKELANEAAALLRSDGTQALPAWIADSERKYKERSIFIVDSTGDDVLKRPLPHHLRKYVGRLQDAGLLGRNKIDSRDIDDPLLLTPLFTDRDGTVYSLMISGPSWPMNMLNATDVRIVVLAFALLTSAFVCWWLARYVSKPVERLQSSARSIAAGNLEARVGTEFSRRKDELGVLARDFDAMADHVRALIASKEDLLRGMSHELRSPLARLRVALGLARRSGEDLARQLDRIELETERLDTLIGQMLQLSQLRAAEPVHTREPVDVATLLGEVVEDARLEASAVNKRVEGAERRNHRRRRATLAAKRDRECIAQCHPIRGHRNGRDGEAALRARPSDDLDRGSRARRTARGARQHLRAFLPRRGLPRSRQRRHGAWPCDHVASRRAARRSCRCAQRVGRRLDRADRAAGAFGARERSITMGLGLGAWGLGQSASESASMTPSR